MLILLSTSTLVTLVSGARANNREQRSLNLLSSKAMY
jgi:hypothetical protein